MKYCNMSPSFTQTPKDKHLLHFYTKPEHNFTTPHYSH